MNHHTRLAKAWLDKRYSRDSQGKYLAHQPIDGLQTDHSEPNALLRLARTFHVLELLDGLDFDTVLDVGGGEGYLAAAVRDLFNPSIAHSSDLSVEACRRAGEIFGIQGLSADSTKLPFADNSYDLVICSEVIEHLSRPVFAIGELARVARKYVLITTAEFCPTGELERAVRSWTLDRAYPHAEINWFTARDFQILLGNDARMSSQFHSNAHLVQNANWSKPQIEKALTFLTSDSPLTVDHTGVIVIAAKNGAAVPTGRRPRSAQTTQRILDRVLDPPAHASTSAEDARKAQELVSRLGCLVCKGGVQRRADGQGLTCASCGHMYEVEDGVPVMLVDDAAPGSAARVDEAYIAQLSAANPGHERVIRRLVAKLHNNESIRNGTTKQWIGTQLLRVLWFVRRDETLGAKLGRVFRRFTGGTSEDRTELQALMTTSADMREKLVEDRG